MGLRLALAKLAATPLFTIFSVISLAAGVAVTTAVYTVVDSVLTGDLGVRDADRIAFVATPESGSPRSGSISETDYDALHAASTSFGQLSASLAMLPSVTTSRQAEVLPAEAVDGHYFATLNLRPQVGRLLEPGDDATAARVAVISDEVWRTRYGADPAVLGRAIRINGQPFDIVGVAERRYRGLYGVLRRTRVWIPRATEPALRGSSPVPAATRRNRPTLVVFGRLADSRTIEQASAEVATVASRLDRIDPLPPPAGTAEPAERRWRARPLDGERDGDSADDRSALMLVALAGLVLVVACTNLANLVLARGAARQGELAVRMAMGASRGRLIWEQSLESLIIAVVGLVASYVAFEGLSVLMTTEYTFGMASARATLSIQPTLDGPALAVAVVSMLLALLVFGLEPAVQLARSVDIRSALAAHASGVRPRLRRQRMVIRWQVALAAGFFILATMFIRGTLQLARHDSGVDLDRIAVAPLNFQNGLWDEPRIRRAIDRVVDEARHDSAIEAIAASTGLPFGALPALQIGLATQAADRALSRPSVDALAVTPSLFRTLGVGVVRGRNFDDRDGPTAPAVALISELTARQLFGSNDPVGRSVVIRRGDRDVTASVIGVARDTDVRFIYANRRPLVYLPLSQHFDSTLTLTARATGDPARAAAALREAIRRADPDLAVETIGTGRATLAGPFELLRTAGIATLYLGGFTLLLSMVGLFGVQSHLVAHRTREIGVRMSVGASAKQIKLLVLKDGYRPVVEGLVLGLWGGLVARMIVRSYFEIDVNVVDPWMLGLTPIPLLAAAFCACYLPAARAARVDPTVSLRAE